MSLQCLSRTYLPYLSPIGPAYQTPYPSTVHRYALQYHTVSDSNTTDNGHAWDVRTLKEVPYVNVARVGFLRP